MNQKNFINLRNALSILYPDVLSIRRIVDDAGIDQVRVDFASNAINSWHSVLTKAEKTGQVDALLGVVEREYGTNEAFLNAYTTYHSTIAQTAPSRNNDQEFEQLIPETSQQSIIACKSSINDVSQISDGGNSIQKIEAVDGSVICNVKQQKNA